LLIVSDEIVLVIEWDEAVGGWVSVAVCLVDETRHGQRAGRAGRAAANATLCRAVGSRAV
jgi:hypothetical protein